MRAALGGILLALALALPARAADICVIVRADDYPAGRMGLSQEQEMKALRTLGIQFDTYDLVSPSLALMDSLQLGCVPNGVNGAWRRYKGLIWLGSVNGITFSGHAAYSMDFFSQIGSGTTRMPPLVPMLWLPAMHTASSFSDAGICSTGVRSQAVDQGKDSSYVAYIPGTGYSFRYVRASYGLRTTIDYNTKAQHVRPLVAYTAGRFTERPVPECQDCYNDLGYAADTLIAWEVDFTLADGTPIYEHPDRVGTPGLPCNSSQPCYKVQPNIYCFVGGPTDGTMMTLLIGLARLDTLTQGAVFRGATGKKVAIGVQAAASLATDSWGSFVADTTGYYQQSIQMLDALGVPYSLQVSTIADTLARATRWFAGLRNARFAPGGGEHVSVGKNPGVANLTTNPIDFLARSRSRMFWTGSVTDTSIANLLKANLDIVKSAFGPQRTDPVMTFPRWAMEFKATGSGPLADSAKAALAYAGYSGASLWWRASPATAINETGLGGLQLAAGRRWVWTNPNIDFGSGRKRLRVLATGSSTFEYNGRMMLGIDAGNFDQPNNILSDDANDGGIRKYLPDAGLDVWMIEAGCFGTRSNQFSGGTPYYRWGYYQFKWLANVIKATEAMCWPGNRSPLQIVTLSQVANTDPHH